MTKTIWSLSVDDEGVLTFPDELMKIMGWGAETVLAWDYCPDGSITLSEVKETAPDTTSPESKS